MRYWRGHLHTESAQQEVDVHVRLGGRVPHQGRVRAQWLRLWRGDAARAHRAFRAAQTGETPAEISCRTQTRPHSDNARKK